MNQSRARPSVLVVDDEASVLSSLHDLLRLDYDVLTCASGQDAVALLRSTPDISVVLSDQQMPGISGVEVLEQARQIRPYATRLLFTAYADLNAVIRAVNEGHIFRYLTKPWEPVELEAVIRQAVERHDLLTEKERLLSELKASNAKLAEANRLKSAFLEVASHELNTPVTVILGLTELWKLSLGNDAAGSERQWLERVNGAARRLARTVNRMLKLVENRQFGQTLDRQPLDLESLIRQVVDELAPYLQLRAQCVEVHVEAGLGTIEADASKLLDVLINLVGNAVKFTPDHGTIRIEAESDAADPRQVRLTVHDEGTGVDPSEQPYLGEPFFTGFDTLHHSSGEFQFCKQGIGLGLCLVKKFVELHGGQVEMQSTPNQGSSFGFVIPRHGPTRVDSGATAGTLANGGSGSGSGSGCGSEGGPATRTLVRAASSD